MADSVKMAHSTFRWLLALRFRWRLTIAAASLLLMPVIDLIPGVAVYQVVEARTPRQLAADSLRSLQRHTDDVVKQVQAYLQATGRWTSVQGNDMALCQALQSFQQSVKRAVSANQGQPYASMQSSIAQIQNQSLTVEQLINQVAPASTASAVWMQVRADMNSLNSTFAVPAYLATQTYDIDINASSTGGYPGNSGYYPGVVPGAGFPGGFPGAVPGTVVNGTSVPGQVIPGTVVQGYTVPGQTVPFGGYPGSFPGAYPGSFVPPGYKQTNINITRNSTFDAGGFGGSPFNQPQMQPNGTNNQAVLSNISSADNQTERFVKQLQNFLQMRGTWPPAQGSPQMILCENVQSFQQSLRKFRSDVQGNVPYPILQSELQQLATTSQNIDQLMLQAGVTPDVTGRWNEIRTSMTGMYQAFYATSTGHYWMR